MTANDIGKIAGGVFAPDVATAIATVVGEFAGRAMFPSDADYIFQMPGGAKAVIVPTCGLAALAGALAGRILGERGWLAPVGAAWTLIGVVWSLQLEAYPAWMMAGGIVLPMVAAAGVVIGMRSR